MSESAQSLRQLCPLPDDQNGNADRQAQCGREDGTGTPSSTTDSSRLKCLRSCTIAQISHCTAQAMPDDGHQMQGDQPHSSMILVLGSHGLATHGKSIRLGAMRHVKYQQWCADSAFSTASCHLGSIA